MAWHPSAFDLRMEALNNSLYEVAKCFHELGAISNLRVMICFTVTYDLEELLRRMDWLHEALTYLQYLRSQHSPDIAPSTPSSRSHVWNADNISRRHAIPTRTPASPSQILTHSEEPSNWMDGDWDEDFVGGIDCANTAESDFYGIEGAYFETEPSSSPSSMQLLAQTETPTTTPLSLSDTLPPMEEPQTALPPQNNLVPKHKVEVLNEVELGAPDECKTTDILQDQADEWAQEDVPESRGATWPISMGDDADVWQVETEFGNPWADAQSLPGECELQACETESLFSGAYNPVLYVPDKPVLRTPSNCIVAIPNTPAEPEHSGILSSAEFSIFDFASILSPATQAGSIGTLWDQSSLEKPDYEPLSKIEPTTINSNTNTNPDSEREQVPEHTSERKMEPSSKTTNEPTKEPTTVSTIAPTTVSGTLPSSLQHANINNTCTLNRALLDSIKPGFSAVKLSFFLFKLPPSRCVAWLDHSHRDHELFERRPVHPLPIRPLPTHSPPSFDFRHRIMHLRQHSLLLVQTTPRLRRQIGWPLSSYSRYPSNGVTSMQPQDKCIRGDLMTHCMFFVLSSFVWTNTRGASFLQFNFHALLDRGSASGLKRSIQESKESFVLHTFDVTVLQARMRLRTRNHSQIHSDGIRGMQSPETSQRLLSCKLGVVNIQGLIDKCISSGSMANSFALVLSSYLLKPKQGVPFLQFNFHVLLDRGGDSVRKRGMRTDNIEPRRWHGSTNVEYVTLQAELFILCTLYATVLGNHDAADFVDHRNGKIPLHVRNMEQISLQFANAAPEWLAINERLQCSIDQRNEHIRSRSAQSLDSTIQADHLKLLNCREDPRARRTVTISNSFTPTAGRSAFCFADFFKTTATTQCIDLKSTPRADNELPLYLESRITPAISNASDLCACGLGHPIAADRPDSLRNVSVSLRPASPCVYEARNCFR